MQSSLMKDPNMAKLSYIVSADTGGIQMLVYRSPDEIGAPAATLASVASEASLSLVDGHGLPEDVRITVSGPWQPTNDWQAAEAVTYALGDAYACEGKRRQARPVEGLRTIESLDILRTLDAIAVEESQLIH